MNKFYILFNIIGLLSIRSSANPAPSIVNERMPRYFVQKILTRYSASRIEDYTLNTIYDIQYDEYPICSIIVHSYLEEGDPWKQSSVSFKINDGHSFEVNEQLKGQEYLDQFNQARRDGTIEITRYSPRLIDFVRVDYIKEIVEKSKNGENWYEISGLVVDEVNFMGHSFNECEHKIKLTISSSCLLEEFNNNL